nr:PREDICTED: LRR receptor-like serine/threonine-protein kinase GSO2 [Daucus carota subsp. sativus]
MKRTGSLSKLVVSFIFIFMFIPCLSCPAHQKQSLLHFKSSLLNATSEYSFLGVFDGLQSWNSTSDCCTWSRVVCGSHSRSIIALHLDDLPAPYPPSDIIHSKILEPIFGIRSLLLLNISYNLIEGEISGEGLANLTKLVHLDMRLNLFNGTIPAQLFQLKFLQFLDLSKNSLKGGLSEVGKLGNLRTLKLEKNLLDGYIPEHIGNLTRLQQFSINYNKFAGQIPNSIGKLKELEKVDLSRNSFTGVIPPPMRNLSKLKTLLLEDNMLSGEIPYGVFEIESLKNLNLGGNKLVWNNNVKIAPKCMLSQLSLKSCKIFADIPEWISTQKNLDILDLSNSGLTGKFPLWLAEMDIKSILMSRNKLTGSIPSRLFQSSSLSILALSKNNFSGELPENIGDAHNIKVLMLSATNFSGAIPKSIADIPKLVLLDLSRNKFSGNTFPVFDPNGSLYYGDFSSNELSGEIPVSFCKDTGILALGENKFSGRLPRGLTNMNELEYLDLHDNNITGNLPEFLSQLSSLEVLSVRNNSLHGSLPSKLFSNESSLQILDLSSNNLVGSIPSELGNLKVMSGGYIDFIARQYIKNEMELNWVENTIAPISGMFTFTMEINGLMVNWKKAIQGLSGNKRHIYTLLDLSNNKLSGDIPVSLGLLVGLKLLNISNNRLSGNIPQSFGDLESIQALDLSNNNISGTIPQSFKKLNELSVVDVSNNKLSGIIPWGGQMDTMNDPSYFANNSGLCGMQIRVTCSEDELKPEARVEGDDGEQESWFLWGGVWIGYPLGFISSILIAFFSRYFVIPTQKYHSIHYRYR